MAQILFGDVNPVVRAVLHGINLLTTCQNLAITLYVAMQKRMEERIGISIRMFLMSLDMDCHIPHSIIATSPLAKIKSHHMIK